MFHANQHKNGDRSKLRHTWNIVAAPIWSLSDLWLLGKVSCIWESVIAQIGFCYHAKWKEEHDLWCSKNVANFTFSYYSSHLQLYFPTLDYRVLQNLYNKILAVNNHWTGLLDYWTGLLDWTTGLDYPNLTTKFQLMSQKISQEKFGCYLQWGHHLQQDIASNSTSMLWSSFRHWLSIDWALAGHWLGIGWALAGHWLGIGWALAEHWLGIRWALAGHWLGMGWALAGWALAGHWLGIGWLTSIFHKVAGQPLPIVWDKKTLSGQPLPILWVDRSTFTYFMR